MLFGISVSIRLYILLFCVLTWISCVSYYCQLIKIQGSGWSTLNSRSMFFSDQSDHLMIGGPVWSLLHSIQKIASFYTNSRRKSWLPWPKRFSTNSSADPPFSTDFGSHLGLSNNWRKGVQKGALQEPKVFIGGSNVLWWFYWYLTKLLQMAVD